MKINILSTVGRKPGGLNRILLECAHHLVLRGHQVRVTKAFNSTNFLFPQGRTIRNEFKNIGIKVREFAYFLSGRRIKNYRCPWMRCAADFFLVPFYQDKYLADADFIIFSSPRFINSISALGPGKGKKIMLVQDPHFVQKFSSIPKNIELIAVSSFIREFLSRQLSQRRIYLLINGVNLSQFSNHKKLFRPAKVVGMVFYNKRPKHKGMEDGIAAFEIARCVYPYLELFMVGLKPERWLPPYVRFFRGFDQEILVNFYRSIDIFLYPSHLDACALPPAEAMACQCALVTTDVGGISDFTIPNKTALVCSPEDIEGLAHNLISLVENPERLKGIALSGYEKIREFSWEHQTQELEGILKDLQDSI